MRQCRYYFETVNKLLHSRLVDDGLWVVLGQGLTAIGLIIGIRLQTEYIPPNVFGTIVLLNGLSALGVGVVCGPFAQGALRFYPEAVANHQQNRLRWMVWSLMARYVMILLFAILLVGGGWSMLGGGEFLLTLLLCGIFVIDSIRTIEMAFLNAARQQRTYAGWVIAEAWGRPLFAVSLVIIFKANAVVVLSGYLLASMLNFLLFSSLSLVLSWRRRATESLLATEIGERIWQYSRPLIPLGLVGWINTLSDRYIITGILGAHQAGIYSAIYSLISRSFTMTQSTLELTLRPVYYQAIAEGKREREWHIYRRWFVLNALAGLVLIGSFVGGSEWIVRYLLGEQYRSSIELIPYLAIGHFFLILAYNLNSYLYAHEYTKEIFRISAVTAIISVIIVVLLTSLWGLAGAAVSSIIYFTIQSGILGWFIWSREHKRV